MTVTAKDIGSRVTRNHSTPNETTGLFLIRASAAAHSARYPRNESMVGNSKSVVAVG